MDLLLGRKRDREKKSSKMLQVVSKYSFLLKIVCYINISYFAYFSDKHYSFFFPPLSILEVCYDIAHKFLAPVFYGYTE